MTVKSVKRMTDEGANETLKEICEGMKEFGDNCTDSAKTLVIELMEKVLNPLAEDDFFGTEGWEHYFGIED